MAELFEMGIREIQAGLMSGEFSAREVAESALARIAEQDKEVHAYLETTEEAALDAAEKIDMVLESGVDLSVIGPLAGIPVAYKDNMNLKGTHTTCSSPSDLP